MFVLPDQGAWFLITNLFVVPWMAVLVHEGAHLTVLFIMGNKVTGVILGHGPLGSRSRSDGFPEWHYLVWTRIWKKRFAFALFAWPTGATIYTQPICSWRGALVFAAGPLVETVYLAFLVVDPYLMTGVTLVMWHRIRVGWRGDYLGFMVCYREMVDEFSRGVYRPAMVRLFSTMVFGVVVAGLAGCASRPPSPYKEMFDAHKRGEVACIRNDVLVRGRENCKRD
jgi:hypothetical protein